MLKGIFLRKILSLALMATVAVSLSACSKSETKTPTDRPDFTTPGNGGGGNNGCVSIDTDGDGLRDCEDPDMDNDGYLNEVDAFPRNPNEWVDSDGDGVGDNSDWAPLDPTEQADRDGDGIGNNADPDDDNDGYPDLWDRLPSVNTEGFDSDLDNIGNNADPDDDNDGVPDFWDDLSWKLGAFDIDHDGESELVDQDLDGDGVGNGIDAMMFDNTETRDFDFDNIGNNRDPDDDNDGVPDLWDDFPLQNNRKFDYDHDGFANEDDAFPYNPLEWADSDGDGVGDNSDAFPNNPYEWKDTDLDGIGDNSDPDADGDGYVNKINPTETLQLNCFVQGTIDLCNDTSGCSWFNARCVPTTSCLNIPNQANCAAVQGCYWTGSSCEESDYLPLYKEDYYDADFDGLGDSVDPDDDNDGVPDVFDEFPTNKASFIDYDQDNIFDLTFPASRGNPTNPLDAQYLKPGMSMFETDPDSDNDGVPNYWDDLIYNPQETFDFDKDGIGDNLDQDDDNDGFFDLVDKFPKDPTEWYNFDETYSCIYGVNSICHDSLGDNEDPDMDNDGVPDAWDNFPYQDNARWDINGNGIYDEMDPDIDGDNFYNGHDDDANPNDLVDLGVTCVGTNPRVCDYLNSARNDAFPFDRTEWLDTDGDKIGNNADPDDDNDGIPDYWDYNSTSAAIRFDIDNDQIDNSIDPDMDGDGYADAGDDLFPYSREDYADNDHDNIGNTIDHDDDNDGVPDYWDDLPLDASDWLDADSDGIGNQADIYTPYGIRNEADLAIAIAHNETYWGVTQSFSTTQCINFNTKSTKLFSVDGPWTITYDGPNSGSMFCIGADEVEIARTRFVISETKNDITVLKSTVNVKDIIFANNELIMRKPFKLADMKTTRLKFYKNNILYNITQTLPANQASMVTVGYNATTEERQEGTFMGNIFYINVQANQTNALSLFKNNNPFTDFKFRYNVFYMKRASGVTMPFSSIIDFNFNSAPAEAQMEVEDNRVNLDITGKLFNVTGTQDVNKMNSFNNKIFGISELGTSNLNQDPIMREVVNCPGMPNLTDCAQHPRCQVNNQTNSCEASSTVIASFATYYNFEGSNMWLAPERHNFFMFYSPYEVEVAASPALFNRKFSSDGYAIIAEASIGQGPTINFIGSYGPIMDSDMDRYADEEDAFRFNPTEWVDADLDGTGNNFDSDDDNDLLLDVFEKSRCQAITDYQTCNESSCSWDENVRICKRVVTAVGDGCQVSGSAWDQSAKCCLKSGVCVDGSDPFDADSDNDGLTDDQEINVYGTNPILADTDGDGDLDGEEVTNQTNPLDPLSSKDTDGDGYTDNFERATFIPMGCVSPETKVDSDGDGLTDYEEYSSATNPSNPCVVDSDGDGVSDYAEVRTYGTQASIADTDGDGRTDGEELNDPDPSKRSNPLLADTDGDGSNDGQEILDGTNPTNNTSFKDTDEDGESDYIDKTPYGVTPCSNTNLAACLSVYTIADYRTEFGLQFTGAKDCSLKTTQATCSDPIKDMCKWDTASGSCQAKSLNIMKDIEIIQCYVPSVGSKMVVRSAQNAVRRKITVKSGVNTGTACSINLNIPDTVGQVGPFHVTNNSSFEFRNIRVEAETGVPVVITSSNVSSGFGQKLITREAEFFANERNGPAIITMNNPVSVDMEKTTIRSLLVAGSAPLNTGNFASARVRPAVNIINATSLNFSGNLIDCNTQTHMSGLIDNNKNFACMKSQSSTTTLDGSVYLMEDSNGIDGSHFLNANNNVIAFEHQQGTGDLYFRNGRVYSHSRGFSINNAGPASVVSLNATRAMIGNNSADFTWTGANQPAPISQLPLALVFGNTFATSTGAELKCVNTNNADPANLNPAYFDTSVTRAYWQLISRPSYDSVQTPGAARSLGGTCSAP